MTADAAKAFQEFLDRHVEKGTAPGLQGVVFDRNGVVFEGAAGVRTLATDDAPAKPMTKDTIHWIASCTKLTVSIIVLRLLEQGAGKDKGLTLDSLDDHEALIRVLPEFKHGSGHNVTQVITGYGDVDADGKRTPILRPAKSKVTLRQLLTHSAGLCYYWNDELMQKWFRPSDETKPHGTLAFVSGAVADFDTPMIREAGEKYTYSPATDWLGQLIIRLTGVNLRQSLIDVLLKPLGIPTSKLDNMTKHLVKEANNEDVSGFVVRGPPEAPPFIQIPFGVYEPEQDDPAPGFAHFASANIHTSLPVYAQILRAVLTHDTRLLQESTWKLAEQDNTTKYGISVPHPTLPTFMPDLSYPIDSFVDAAPDAHKDGASTSAAINLLQAHVALTPTQSGLQTGAFEWAGLANTYWFIDPAQGFGAVFGTQLLPFADPQMFAARNEWEKLVATTLNGRA